MPLSGPDSPLPPIEEPTDQDQALIDAVAGRIVRMGLTAPAVFFLESAKPLSYIGSQALVFLEPFVKSFLNLASYDRFVALMEDRRSIEKLILRVEELDETERKAEKERKREARERKAREKAARTGGVMGYDKRPSGGRLGWWSRLWGRRSRGERDLKGKS